MTAELKERVRRLFYPAYEARMLRALPKDRIPQHIGVMPRDDAERVLAFTGRQLRRAFLSPMGYRLTGISRADVFQGTFKHAQARSSMDEVPADILNGERRAPHAPVRPMPASRLAQHLDLRPQPPKV